MKSKLMKPKKLKLAVSKHLKEDVKESKESIREDKKLMSTMKKKVK